MELLSSCNVLLSPSVTRAGHSPGVLNSHQYPCREQTLRLTEAQPSISSAREGETPHDVPDLIL